LSNHVKFDSELILSENGDKEKKLNGSHNPFDELKGFNTLIKGHNL